MEMKRGGILIEHGFIKRVKNNRSLYFIIFQWIIIIAGYIFLCNRIRFGIDFTDEPWYVAEPYFVANGAIPYVNNWTQAPGFTLPLALLFKLYVMITGGTEGIVLYSRVLYAVVSFVVYAASIFIIAGWTKHAGLFIAIFPLLFHPIYSLYDLSYNTIGVMYLFLGCVLLLFGCGEEDCESRKRRYISTVSGIIVARTIIASPSVLAAWAGILIILAVQKKRRQLLRFIGGNAITATLVIGWCCMRGGIGGFLNGMRVFLTETAYFQIEQRHTFQDDIIYVFHFCKPLCVSLMVLIILKLLRKKKLFFAEKWYRHTVLIICAVCLITGIAKGVHLGSYKHFIRYGWYEAILMASFLDCVNEDKKGIMNRFAWISGVYFAVYILTSATNIYGFGSREYWLIIPVVLGCLSWYFALNDRLPVIMVVFSINLLFGFFLMKENYRYVFRDQPITDLTMKIDYGIWKGLYTTEKRAENVKMLEQYIRKITCEDDRVLFLDEVCFAYMMTDAKACTTSTLDPLLWSYKVDNAIIMEEYFKIAGEIPDKIIYIDFGRDAVLSIDSECTFNTFVKNNYILVDTYDTDPSVLDKYAESAVDASSFYVKYYAKRE